MKNIILFFVFSLISILAFSQKNEVALSYQPFQDDVHNKEVSISYFRNSPGHQAIGLKIGFRGLGRFEEYTNKVYKANIDLVNRWNFSKNKKVRFMGELGMSVLREFINFENRFIFCGFGNPTDHSAGGWHKTNYLGITSGLVLDFTVFKYFNLGASYNINFYFTNSETYEQNLQTSNFNLRIGTKF